MIQRVGGSIGTALLTVVLQNGIAHRLAGAAPGASRAVVAPAFSHTYWVLFAVTAVALAPALHLARVESRLRARAVADPPEPVAA